MTEAQFNATRRAEKVAAQLAEKFGLRRPTFWLPHTDDDIFHFHVLASMADFLEAVDGASIMTEVVAEAEVIEVPPVPPPSLSDALRDATLDELEEIPGIGKVTARRIKEGLR